MQAPLLRLTGIRKSFGGVRALAGVDLELRGGSITALLGENGAGKSTLVKILTGVHQPDGGVVELDQIEKVVAAAGAVVKVLSAEVARLPAASRLLTR